MQARSIRITNGIEVSPDDKLLCVNESVQRKVWFTIFSAIALSRASSC
ncbi:MAG TPA: hypothetical protein VEX68_12765 [Bryobacteraceae bacterium]|nr:hypothetical protein [Bryobacteraceae bacterium]